LTGAATGAAAGGAGGAEKIRIDKWLWQARFFKSRGLAGEVAGSGAVRVNGERIAKPAHGVRAGDVLTFPQAGHIRVVRNLSLGTRRGPAAEAQALYDDLDPRVPRTAGDEHPDDVKAGLRNPASGRPDKRHRREITALRRRDP
jgi:ribosome-associated heat shock protein Hsp15